MPRVNWRWCVLLVSGLIPGVETELGWWNSARLERHTRELGRLLRDSDSIIHNADDDDDDDGSYGDAIAYRLGFSSR